MASPATDSDGDEPAWDQGARAVSPGSRLLSSCAPPPVSGFERASRSRDPVSVERRVRRRLVPDARKRKMGVRSRTDQRARDDPASPAGDGVEAVYQGREPG